MTRAGVAGLALACLAACVTDRKVEAKVETADRPADAAAPAAVDAGPGKQPATHLGPVIGDLPLEEEPLRVRSGPPPAAPAKPTAAECAARHPDVTCEAWTVEGWSSCSGARVRPGYVQRVQWRCLCHECEEDADCPVPGSLCSRLELTCNPPSNARCLPPDHPCRSASCPPSRCSVHEKLGQVQCISDAPPP